MVSEQTAHENDKTRDLRHLVDGREFILDAPDHVPAILGHGDEVLWAQGEVLQIVGPDGVGKTTFMQQLALRRAGVHGDDLIGFPVASDPERLLLYLALDRPQQIARSFRRMVTEDDAAALAANVCVWRAPLMCDLISRPESLLTFVQHIGQVKGKQVGTVVIDSLKDLIPSLSEESGGASLHRALSFLIAEGIEVVAAHHQRKATGDNKKPTSLADVYGSRWITAGAGSVVLLWGNPGDPIVQLTHLKQPAEDVGPIELSHDHTAGVTTRCDRLDPWTILQGATSGGISAAAAAQAIYGKPSRGQIEKVRRKFERFVRDDQAVRIKGDPIVYRPTPRDVRDSTVTGTTQASRASRSPVNIGHAPVTGDHGRSQSAPPPYRGARDVSVTENVTREFAAPNGSNGASGHTALEPIASVAQNGSDEEASGLRGWSVAELESVAENFEEMA